MKGVLLFLFLSLCFFLVLSDQMTIPTPVRNGFFSGRSSEFLIAPKNFESWWNGKSSSGSAAFIKTSHTNTNKDQQNSVEVEDVSFAGIISGLLSLHSFSSSSSNLENLPSFLSSQSLSHSADSHPRANFFVALDGVTQQMWESKTHQKWFLGGGEEGKKGIIKLRDTSYPLRGVDKTSLAQLTTLLTGVSPSLHGVLSSPAAGSETPIVPSSVDGHPFVSNLPDYLSQISSGKSHIVSVSASESHARASCAHAFSLSAHPYSNSFCYFWNPSTQAVDAISMQVEESFLLTRSQLLQALANNPNKVFGLSENSDLKVSFESTTYTLTISSSSMQASFNLDQEEDFMLVVELFMAYELNSLFDSKTFKQFAYDDSPDHFGISFSSLKSLINKYGSESAHINLALDLIDRVIADLIQHAEKLYEGRICSEVVVLGKNTDQELLNTHILQSLKGTSFFELIDQTLLPQITLLASPQTPVLEELRAVTKDTDLQVIHQYSRSITHKRSFDVSLASNTTISGAQLAQFQICLWVPIVVAIVLILVVLSMYDMNSGRDSLLYAPPGQGKSSQPPQGH